MQRFFIHWSLSRGLWGLGVLLGVLLLSMASLSCGGESAGNQKVTLALDWFKNPDHAGILVA